MTDEEFEALKEECRQQRLRGVARHHSYELATHSRLYRMYVAERNRRDTLAIDAAMERYHRILEAAQ